MSQTGVRSRPKEVFRGPRLSVQVAPVVRARSAFLLAVLSVVMGGAAAVALAVGVDLGVRALMHSVGAGS